ncbi:MAG: glutaredoxin family protein [Minisyncoccota bacterium]
MLNQKIIGLLIGTVVLIVGVLYWGMQDTQAPTDDPNAVVYYYGDGCPHCKVIDEFLIANDIAGKMSFEKKEVWKNIKNSNEMKRRAKVCGVAPEGMGVPFVYAEGQCFVGEPDVKAFFIKKSSLKSQDSANISE